MQAGPDSHEEVFRARTQRACGEVALLLEAIGLRPVVHDLGGEWIVVVAGHDAHLARREIYAWLAENRPRPLPPARQPLADGRRGVVAYVLLVAAVALAVANHALGRDWLAAGRVDGGAMIGGEWWRALTALSLHSGLEHLAANIFFGSVFGWFAGRYLGSGIAWLLILLAGGLGNVVNVLVLGESHHAIGASTAVFAALGLLGSLAWAGRRRSGLGWSYRWGPVIAAVALLAYTGSGGERTDIGAHIWGFVAGLAAGLLAARVPLATLVRPEVQGLAGALAAALFGAAWWLALT